MKIDTLLSFTLYEKNGREVSSSLSLLALLLLVLVFLAPVVLPTVWYW